jgi:hypothetical protein
MLKKSYRETPLTVCVCQMYYLHSFMSFFFRKDLLFILAIIVVAEITFYTISSSILLCVKVRL